MSVDFSIREIFADISAVTLSLCSFKYFKRFSIVYNAKSKQNARVWE